MKDLDIVCLFSPDNLQLSAMKLELENLILKNQQGNFETPALAEGPKEQKN